MTEESLLICEDLLDSTLVLKSDILISEWFENRIITPPGNALPKISYDYTPFWREPVNCFHPSHPARDITIMAMAQGGKTKMVLNPVMLYTIGVKPEHMMLFTGTTELTKDAVGRLDEDINACDLRQYISANVIKAKGGRTGDTTYRKEYKGRRFVAGSIANHNMMRQNEGAITLADDLDAGVMAKDGTGGTVPLIKGRTKAHEYKCKRGWICSPQERNSSLIYAQYQRSDQRLYYIPCQCCHEMIDLRLKIKIDENNWAGLHWKLDSAGRVDPKSVHYVCQLCAGGFTDKNKFKFLNDGLWKPQVESPLDHDHYGYHINGLYLPYGMTSWFNLAHGFHVCCPPNAPRNEPEYQTYLNVQIGDVYEAPEGKIDASKLENNIRGYEIGKLPEKTSIQDGNGRIVLVTCSADLGGRYIGDQINSDYDDARLDYELMAHTESGATYSLEHGSIGTFKPAFMGQERDGRELWTYDISKPNNVWKEFIKRIDRVFETDTGRKMKVGITCIDTGFADIHAWSFIDRYNLQGRRIIGIKGDKEHRPVTFGISQSNFRQSQSRPNLFTLIVGQLKDQLASRIALEWNGRGDQPPGFLNFPERANGLYTKEGYFSHFEAEIRKVDKKNNFIWEKKNAQSQNHFFDCCIYNFAAREILMKMVLTEVAKHDKSIDVKVASWRQFSDWLLEQYDLGSMLK